MISAFFSHVVKLFEDGKSSSSFPNSIIPQDKMASERRHLVSSEAEWKCRTRRKTGLDIFKLDKCVQFCLVHVCYYPQYTALTRESVCSLDARVHNECINTNIQQFEIIHRFA